MIELRDRRIVIIGGAGFIGHSLALALAAAGADVHVVDSLQVNNLLWFASRPDDAQRTLFMAMLNERLDLLRRDNIPLHPQDARDYHAVSRLLSDIKPTVIVHLAAVSHAGRSNKDPYSTFDHSLRTLENALDWARGDNANVERFVYLSSSMAYGNFEASEVSEDHPLNPIGIYGALKVAGEKLVIAYQQVFDLPYTIVRPSALYGPRCVSRRVGQIFIENALNGSTLRVDGDGTERLDFTYIDDLVSGIVLAIRKPAGRNQVFNLTYGEARSIREVLDIVLARYPGAAVQYVERDDLMPTRGTLSVEKARRLLGYEPANPIEVGFAKYMTWYDELMQRIGAPPVR
jgi:nucleoside-diphosphate-sugar epimerase